MLQELEMILLIQMEAGMGLDLMCVYTHFSFMETVQNFFTYRKYDAVKVTIL